MDINSLFDPVLAEDLERISNSSIPFERFRNKRFLITGATGLIGFSIIRALIYADHKFDLHLQINAVIRDTEKAKQIYGDLMDWDRLKFTVTDLARLFSIESPADFVIHCAGITNSKLMISKPVETIESSVFGTHNILEYCVSVRPESAVYISSMEMYGQFEDEVYVNEGMIGFLDPLIIRSNYPESKRMCENMCIAYNSEYHVPVKIARLAQTFGAGILPGENRVFSQFAGSVLEKKDIVLHTPGKSQGNYCYLSDSVTGILLILTDGGNGEAYNVSNENNHCTISDMAHMVAENFGGGKVSVVFDIPSENIYGYAKDTKMKLDSSKLRSLGWTPCIDLPESYRRMIECMKYHRSKDAVK